MPKDAKPYSLDLETEKIQFLERVTKERGLPNAGKAIRCLINYAREHPDLHANIFDEVRCLDC